MSVLIDNFALGWINKARHELIKDTSVFVATDVDFIETGSFKCRKRHSPHYEYFNTRSAYSTSVKNIYKIEVEGEDKQLIYYTANNYLYRWNSITNITAIISSSINGSNHVCYAALKPELSDYTYVYITDGTTMLSDNGTTTKTWGIDPPTGSVNVEISTFSGQLSAGDYSYVYTFFDASTGSESDPSPACAAITAAANEAIEITALETSSDTRVTSRRLYRTVANGGTRYLLGIIPDNVVKEYTDFIPDANLTIAAVTDQGIPPTGKLVTAIKDTLFVSGNTNYNNRIYFSLPEHPDNFPSTYYVEVGDIGERVQNMMTLESKLHFVTPSGIYGLYGENADTYDTYETKAGVGTYARWSCATVAGGLFYLARDGVYRFDGVRSVRISSPIDRLFWDSPSSLYSVVDKGSAIDNAIGTTYNGKYYLTIPLKGTTGSTSNKLLEYDPTEQQWRLIGTRVDCVYGDDCRGVFFGSTDYQFSTSSGTYSVYNLLAEDSGSSYDTPSMEVVTRAYDITAAPEYELKGADKYYLTKERRTDEVVWLKEFRVDADGEWTLDFYLDGAQMYSTTLTNLSRAKAYEWHLFPSKKKGRYLYVKITHTGGYPTTQIFRELEVR